MYSQVAEAIIIPEGAGVMDMDKYYGRSVCGGIAEGELYVFTHNACPVRRYHIESSADEIQRLNRARAEAAAELERLFIKTSREINAEDAQIFITQIMMLEDSGFTESIYNIISDEMVNAETAVAQTADKYIQIFIDSDNEYIGLRSFDIRDVSERVIRILLGMQQSEILTSDPVIIAAHDLPPSDIVRFDCSKILGFIIERGDENSHAAILARSKGVPAIMQAGNIIADLQTGTNAIIDGTHGILYVDPDTETRKTLLKQ